VARIVTSPTAKIISLCEANGVLSDSDSSALDLFDFTEPAITIVSRKADSFGS
jgi:hypothetical protein